MSIKPPSLTPFLLVSALFWCISVASSPASAMEWEHYGANLVLTGTIEPEDGQGFTDLIASEQFNNVQTVSIGESNGGSVLAAIDIGLAIHARGWDTVVHGQCASACSIIAAGGQERWVAMGGSIGVHWVSFDTDAPLDLLPLPEQSKNSNVDCGGITTLWASRPKRWPF